MKRILYLFCALMMMQSYAIAQCFPDRHSTNFFDGWVSCEATISPNPARPVSHFILYDFGKTFSLGQMTIWNSNDPSHLDYGMREVAIDYSLDAQTWHHAGDFVFEQASGLSTYEGAEGPNLNDIEARFLLITALSNYGGECYGISEMNVVGEEVVVSDVEDIENLDCVEVKIYPNPFTDQMTMVLSPGCSGDLRILVYNGSGQMIYNETSSLVTGQQKSLSLGRDLPPGAYNVSLEYGGKSVQRKIVKMNR